MNSRPTVETARCILVRGRVQGVYFRASTAKRAIALSLRGTAENLADGSVRVLAVGQLDALTQLIDWLRTGPPMARVDEVEVEEIDAAAVQWPPVFRTK